MLCYCGSPSNPSITGGQLIFEDSLFDLINIVSVNFLLWFANEFLRSESVERDGAEFFSQQGLDEDYGAGEVHGVSGNIFGL